LDRRVELEGDVEVAAQQRGGHVGRRSEGNDRRLDIGRALEQLGGEVLSAAGIDGSDVEFPGPRARGRDEVLHGFQGRSRPRHDQQVEEGDG
jgi:hypothetical protein